MHLCRIADELERKGVNLKVLDQSIDTGDATGRLLFNMLGAIAQFETEIRSERQRDGITKARAQGVRFGAKKKLTPRQVIELQYYPGQIGSIGRGSGKFQKIKDRHLKKSDTTLVYLFLVNQGRRVVEFSTGRGGTDLRGENLVAD